LNHLLLQKRDGSLWLVLWLEEASFDADAETPITVTPQEVTLTIAVPEAQQVLNSSGSGNMKWVKAFPLLFFCDRRTSLLSSFSIARLNCASTSSPGMSAPQCSHFAGTLSDSVTIIVVVSEHVGHLTRKF
jgi:hypothetical protein